MAIERVKVDMTKIITEPEDPATIRAKSKAAKEVAKAKAVREQEDRIRAAAESIGRTENRHDVGRQKVDDHVFGRELAENSKAIQEQADAVERFLGHVAG